MGWVRRGTRCYYYRSRREDGRVVKDYIGTGPVAEAVAKMDFLDARLRDQIRELRMESQAELVQLDTSFEQLDRTIRGIVSAAMEAAGYHCHRGEWRKTKMDTTNKPPVSPPRPSKQELLSNPQLVEELEKRAGAGDRDAFTTLLPIFDQLHLVDTVGDVALRSIRVALSDLVGKNLLSEEATLRKMDELRLELAGANPTPLERLLVDRVVSMWFHLHKLEREFSLSSESPMISKSDYQRAITSAQKRYFAAIRELMLVRRHPLAALPVSESRESRELKATEPVKPAELPKPHVAPEG